MKKPGYIPVLCVALGLVMAGTGGLEVTAGVTASQEPSAVQPDSRHTGADPVAVPPVETPEEEQVPQSDIVIDRIGGEVTVGPNEVVRRAKLLFGELEIDGQVVEDVQMIAGEIEIRGRVYDRVELVAGEVIISGHVGPGGVDVKFGEVRVSGVVEGPVTVEFGEVTLTEEGVIRGPVRVEYGEFSGPRERVEDSVTVDEPIGGIGRNRARDRLSDGLREGLKEAASEFIAFIGLMTLLGLAVTILVLAILFRNTIQRGTILMEKENLAWNLLWGGLAVLLFLPIFVMLCVTIIGIPVAFLLLFLYPVAWLFGLILLANYLGDWILTSLVKGQSNFLVGTIFGIIVLGISLAVPVFGPILMIIYTLLAIGLSLRLMFGYFQDRREPPTPPEVTAAA
ncbi:hypothetical protein MYX82_00700 [Acidobacteria bacterium AH-259-D05]|nr:hypothetical protein [Acidobacteria bacterium AH-259-D05]